MATWHILNTATGLGNGSDFTNAYVSTTALLTAQNVVASDILKYGSSHVETVATTTTLTLPEGMTNSISNIRMESVNVGSGTQEIGARIIVNTGDLILNLRAHVYGMIFETAATASGQQITIGGTSSRTRQSFEDCTFKCLTTNAGSSAINIGCGGGSGNIGNELSFKNCVFHRATNGQGLNLRCAKIEMINCSLGGVAQTTVFWDSTFYAAQGEVVAYGCNFPGTNLVNVGVAYQFTLKMFNSIVPSNPVIGTYQGLGGPIVELHACTASDRNYDFFGRYESGIINHTTGVYKETNGFSLTNNSGGVINYSLYITSSSYCSFEFPVYTPWVAVEITSTGSKVVSMEIAHTLASVLTNKEAWIEVAYMGGTATANTPQMAISSSFPALASGAKNVISSGSNLTDTAASWIGLTGEKTHVLSQAVTVNEIGWLQARVGFGKPSSSIYVDLKAVIT